MKLKSSSLLFIQILLTLNSSTFALFHSEIDEKLSDANSGRIYKENRIRKVLQDFSKQIQNCKSNVKNFRDVSNALENFNNLIQLLMTIDSFKAYENISTCGDLNYKIIKFDFDQRKLICTMDQVRVNTSLLYKSQSELLTAYYSNLNALGYLSTTERSVWNVTQQLNQILSPYWDYLRTLTIDYGNLNYFNSLLMIFKKNYCQCLETTSYSGKNSTLEANVQVIESRLIDEQKRILNLTSIALSNVNSALKSSSSTALQSLQKLLLNINSISDYPKISWSNIKNCNDFWIRVKFLEFKRSQYLGILISANLNSSLLTSNEVRLNSSGTSDSSILTVINSTINLRRRYSSYSSLLGYATVKMSKMISDFGYLADTHCSCEIGDDSTTPAGSTTSNSAGPTSPTTRSISTSMSVKPTTSTITTLSSTSISTTPDPTTTSSTTITTSSTTTSSTSTSSTSTSTSTTSTSTTSTTTTPTTSSTSTTTSTTSTTTPTTTTTYPPCGKI